MTDRERKLAIGMVAVVGLWGGSALLPENALSPFKEKNDQIVALKESVNKLSDEETSQMLRVGELKQWQTRSLPPDPLVAQRLYQIWLVDLAEFSGFDSIVPTLGGQPVFGQRASSRSGRKEEPLGNTVNVTLKGKATLEQVATFLYHFERTALLHRITQCDITSTDIDGNPKLQVTIAAEGLALSAAPSRNRLFPQSLLKTPLAKNGRVLEVDSDAEFPPQGEFRIRIGRELLQVSKRIEPGKWEVQRGVEGSNIGDFKAGDIVELAPIALPRDPEAPRSMAEYRSLLAAGPYTRPAPPIQYRPALKSISDQTVLQGNTFTAKISLSGWDPSWQPAVLKLDSDAPAGMTLTPQGEINWKTTIDQPTESHTIKVLAFREGRDEAVVSTKFRVTVKQPNRPPNFTPARPAFACLGRPFSTIVSATDPDARGSLKFSLSGSVPEGATIEPVPGQAGSARIIWTPSLTLDPGDYIVKVQVQDSGDPPLQATLDVTITAEDDFAVETYFVGAVREGESRTAMLTSRLDNRTFYHQPGDELSVNDVHGTIETIGDRHLILKSEGKLYRLQLGQNLRQLSEFSSTDNASTEKGRTDNGTTENVTPESNTTIKPTTSAPPSTTSPSGTTTPNDSTTPDASPTGPSSSDGEQDHGEPNQDA
ncbi:MAG: cadherin repeat domain-containing protein [Planctomycetaceae bacterium]